MRFLVSIIFLIFPHWNAFASECELICKEPFLLTTCKNAELSLHVVQSRQANEKQLARELAPIHSGASRYKKNLIGSGFAALAIIPGGGFLTLGLRLKTGALAIMGGGAYVLGRNISKEANDQEVTTSAIHDALKPYQFVKLSQSDVSKDENILTSRDYAVKVSESLAQISAAASKEELKITRVANDMSGKYTRWYQNDHYVGVLAEEAQAKSELLSQVGSAYKKLIDDIIAVCKGIEIANAMTTKQVPPSEQETTRGSR